MAKAIIYSNKNTLKGVYSNKKNLWNQLEQDEDVSNLLIKLNPVKTTDLTYSKVVKYLKERSMLRIYKKSDIVEYENNDNVENCLSYIRLWETEINKKYKMKD